MNKTDTIPPLEAYNLVIRQLQYSVVCAMMDETKEGTPNLRVW